MDGWINGTLIDAFAQAQPNFHLHYLRLLWEAAISCGEIKWSNISKIMQGALLTYCSRVPERGENSFPPLLIQLDSRPHFICKAGLFTETNPELNELFGLL